MVGNGEDMTLDEALRRMSMDGEESLDEAAGSSERETGEKGGYRFDTPALKKEVKYQRKLMWDFISGMGSKLWEGANLTKISLPVGVFEPRSFVERISDCWIYYDYLERAAVTSDPVERMKLVIAFGVSGLVGTLDARKPFNPILGETYQGVYGCGAEFFSEQVCHHPPVSRWEVLSKPGCAPEDSYVFTGEANWTATVSGNSLKGRQSGVSCIEFGRDGATVTWELPFVCMKGVMWGTRVLYYSGEMVFVDAKNKLRAEIKVTDAMSARSIKQWWNGEEKTPDSVKGAIYQCVNPLVKVDGAGNKGVALAQVDGIWLTHLDVDGKRIWARDRQPTHRPRPVDNPLPSDCRYRGDLIALKGGDMAEAQLAKEAMERDQRRDAKLRKEGLERNG